MQQEARRRLLLKAIRDAVIELAARADRARHGTALLESAPEMIAISALDIFEVLRPRVPNLTLDEVENTIMQSLPYLGGQTQ